MKKLLVVLLLLLSFVNWAFAVPGSPTLWERAVFANIPGIAHKRLVGSNGAITTTFEPLWPETAAYTVLATNMSSPYIVSSSANDTSAGTGARTATVTCVDSSFVETSTTYSLNGQTSVNLTQSCMVINNIEVITAGSGGVNAGVIRVGTGANSSGVPAVVHGHVAAGINQSESAIYAVPANYSLICRDWVLSSKGGTAANTTEFVIDSYVNLGILKRRTLGYLENGGGNPSDIAFMNKFVEKTVIVVQALSAANTGPVSVSADCLLISNTWENTPQELL